jgi:hypothetical protein
MIHSSRRDRKTKAIAEVLAMIADAYPELAPDRPRSDREAEEWLWEIATGYCDALDRYAARAMQVKRANHLYGPPPPASRPSQRLDACPRPPR